MTGSLKGIEPVLCHRELVESNEIIGGNTKVLQHNHM